MDSLYEVNTIYFLFSTKCKNHMPQGYLGILISNAPLTLFQLKLCSIFRICWKIVVFSYDWLFKSYKL